MSEQNTEINTEVVNIPVVEEKEVVTETPVELSPDEQRAMEHGWRPKEEWEGDPEDWVSAREFNRRGELFARIAKYGNENKEMRESLKKLFNQHRQLYDAGYKKALNDLKQQKLEAADVGDTRKLLEIDEQIDNLREEHKNAIETFDKEVATPSTPATNEEHQLAYEQWMSVNPWYGKNADLTRVADTLAREMVSGAQKAGKTVDYKQVLATVAKEVRANNPQYFDKERKTSNVDTGSPAPRTRGNGNSKYSLSQIPEGERDIARTILASTGMKEEEYVKQYLNANR